jgi:predicted TIM-barrel fold metal-dependent hydrolase
MLDEIRIIDADTHVVEPPDLWTSRLPAKWADRSPQVEWDQKVDQFRWKVGNVFLSAVAAYAVATWKGPFPSHPATLEESDPACFEAESRLRYMDETGIFAQVLYPNLIGFESHAFINQLGPEMALDCVRVYNDFIAEFASADTRRLLPTMMLPFWDPEASVAELRRAHALGHKGILLGAQLERIGFPNISDGCYDPILAEAEERELPVNFHLGFNSRKAESREQDWEIRAKVRAKANRRVALPEGEQDTQQGPDRAKVARYAISHYNKGQVNIIDAAMDVILGGLCQKFPNLKFVSVESGFGHWPYYLEYADSLCKLTGAYPKSVRRPPSEQFRQSYLCTFMDEEQSVPLFEGWQDNVMFSTDFPHQRTDVEVPAPREMVKQRLSDLKPKVAEKIFHGNAARIYHVD